MSKEQHPTQTEEQRTVVMTLCDVLAMNRADSEKQLVLEKTLMQKDRSNNLSWFSQTDNQIVLKSKKKAHDCAKTVIQNTRLIDEMDFVTPEFLTALSLNVITRLFVNINVLGKEFSFNSVVKAIADHLIRQMAWQLQKDLADKTITLTEQGLKEKEEKDQNAAIRLVTKYLDYLKNAGVIKIIVRTENSGSTFKKRKIVTLIDEWFELALRERERNTILPMLTKPLDWKLQECCGENRLISGGYLKNQNIQKTTTALLEYSDKISKVSHTEESRDNVNYRQSIPLRINEGLLFVVQQNVMKIPQYRRAFNFTNGQTRRDIHVKNLEFYDQESFTLSRIDHALNICSALKSTTIYFPIAHDGRGRLHPMSYLFSTTVTNYMRSLIECKEKYEFFPEYHKAQWGTFVRILADRLGTSVTNLKKNPNQFLTNLSEQETIKDFSLYTFLDIYKTRGGNTAALIGLDCTISGLQIMSLICGAEEGLALTDVFKNHKAENHDIYWQIQKNVVDKYPILKFMTREEYKAIIMKLSYGESTYSRAKTIGFYLRRIGLVKSRLLETIHKIEGLTDEDKKKYIPSNYTIAQMYDISIEMEFKNFKLLKKHINYVVDKKTQWNLPMNFKVSNIHQTSQYYTRDHAKTYTFNGHNGQTKRLTMCVPEVRKTTRGVPESFEAIADKKRTKRSTLPNLVHHLDSSLLHGVVTRMRQKGLPLFTVHDAFYCRLTDTEILKDAYFESLQDIQKANPWISFLETNKVQRGDVQDSLEAQRVAFNDELTQMCQNVPELFELSHQRRGPDILK